MTDSIDAELVRRLARAWYGESLPEPLAEIYARLLAANREARAGETLEAGATPAHHAATLDRLAEDGR